MDDEFHIQVKDMRGTQHLSSLLTIFTSDVWMTSKVDFKIEYIYIFMKTIFLLC